MRRAIHLIAALAVASCVSCAFLPSLHDEDAGKGLEIPVVDESDGFNPREAVDDDDDAGVASALGLASESSIDQGAFEEPDVEKQSEDLEELPYGESVATTGEVADLIQEREVEVAEARGGKDDRADKVKVASNPFIAPRAPAESRSAEVRDVVMETVLIGVLSLLLAALATLFHRLPSGFRTGLVVATLGLGAWVGFSLG